MCGAIPPLSDMPARSAQGQIHCYQMSISAEKKLLFV